MKSLRVALPTLFFLAALVAPSSLAAQLDLSGSWMLTLQSPEGVNSVPVTFSQEGAEVTATFGPAPGGPELFTGTVSESGVRLVWFLEWNGMPLEITMTGGLRDGELSGMADFSGMAQGDWTARRVEP